MSARGGAGNQYSVSRLFSEYDEDVLGKKDDDRHNNNRHSSSSGSTGSSKKWALWRYRSRRRWVLLAAAVFVLWVLLRGIPSDFWEPNQTGEMRAREFGGGGVRRPYPPPPPSSRGGGREEDQEEGIPPPRPKGRVGKHYYDGEVLFRKLPGSLHGSARTLGFKKVNQNVLFAVSSLKSAATLIPLACEMTKWERSFVHVAVFGRSDMPLDEVRKINGVDARDCNVYWHDARPNWAGSSSDFRAEAGVASALEFVQQLMHPQVVVMDDSTLEDAWFTRQIRIKADKFEWPVIELPAGASEKLQWITRLDAQSLKNFHWTSVDVVVRAPTEAGNLMRLLTSLAEADYHGLTPPRVTVELPAEIDPMTKWFLAGYKWPPRTSPLQPMMSSQLMLRHRIPGQKLSPEEASTRFLESFYPAQEQSAHVLVLNPNVELSKLWYHWLKYHILQYKHSRSASAAENVMGISLDVPGMHLNGTTKFESPNGGSPFLWQAPASDAVLYYGDKWIELQDFLRHRLRTLSATPRKAPHKIVGEQFPAWTEYALELMRARGWSVMYPSTPANAGNVVTVHQELYKPPEEFGIAFLRAKTGEQREETEKEFDGEEEEEEEEMMGPLRGVKEHWEQQRQERPLSEAFQPLHSLLPTREEEKPIEALVHLLYDGARVERVEMGLLAESFAETFRRGVAGCPDEDKGKKRDVVKGQAGDLFCWVD